MSDSTPILNEEEIECLKMLAELFPKNQSWVSLDVGASEKNAFTYDPMKLPPDQRFAILTTMENLGFIANVTHVVDCPFVSFTITAKAVQAARRIADQELAKQLPSDIVKQVNEKVRSTYWLAWALIAFFILMAISTVVNQTMGILEKLGWLPK